MVGNVVFQFIRPTPDLPTWHDQLETRGPGVHNVTISVSDPEATVAAMTAHGATLDMAADVDLRDAGLEYEGDLKAYVIDGREPAGLRFEMFSSKCGWVGGQAP
jgi:hypothetical protein